jgi:hypothetical protein
LVEAIRFGLQVKSKGQPLPFAPKDKENKAKVGSKHTLFAMPRKTKGSGVKRAIGDPIRVIFEIERRAKNRLKSVSTEIAPWAIIRDLVKKMLRIF